MANIRRHKGFSLTEVLMAVGVMAVGMIFIAALFPVGHQLSNLAAERTIAAVVADEAFAKIKLHGVDLDSPQWTIASGNCVNLTAVSNINPTELSYPSVTTSNLQRKYHWSALCRRIDSHLVQVTVFISRLTGAGTRYWDRNPVAPMEPREDITTVPVPLFVDVTQGAQANELKIQDHVPQPGDTINEETFINDGYRIVDNQTGRIYQVTERDPLRPTTIILNQNWDPRTTPNRVWVIPPPASGGRNPCIAVYQKVIRF